MPVISVIVPIYNVEKYLPECIESILAQTLMDFELILIDDGSLDRSGEICDQFAKKDKRIKVIHKKNGGVSSARNRGIDIAKGVYLSFIDPDDTIEPSMYEVLLKFALEHDVDIVVCPINTINHITNTVSKSSIWREHHYPLDRNKIEKYLIPSVLEEKTYSLVSSVNKLYKSALFNKTGIRFDEQKHHSEDARLNFTLLTMIKNLIYVEHPLYNYHIRKRDSLTQIFRENLHEYALDNKQFLIGMCKKYRHEKYIDKITNHFTEVILGHMQDVVYRDIQRAEKYRILSDIINNQEFIKDLHKYKNQRLYYKLLKMVCINKKVRLFFTIVRNKVRLQSGISKVL